MARTFLDARFEQLLDEIAAETPAPGGGSVSALVAAAAAGLVAMAARYSKQRWDGAGDAAGRAEHGRLLPQKAGGLAGPAGAADRMAGPGKTSGRIPVQSRRHLLIVVLDILQQP